MAGLSLLDEELVEEWLKRQGFFTMRGIKCGVDEIDLLAVREGSAGIDHWHVEVQISFRPTGYIGGDRNASRRSEREIRAGVRQWVEKKFTKALKVERRLRILPNANWLPVFVHGVVRDGLELEVMREAGVRVVPYRSVLSDLLNEGAKGSSTLASNILEIVDYARRELPFVAAKGRAQPSQEPNSLI